MRRFSETDLAELQDAQEAEGGSGGGEGGGEVGGGGRGVMGEGMHKPSLLFSFNLLYTIRSTSYSCRCSPKGWLSPI